MSGNIRKYLLPHLPLLKNEFDELNKLDELNSGLKKISDWAYQWKMKFNPNPNKQAQEIHFSNTTNKDSSLFITFNNSKLETIS